MAAYMVDNSQPPRRGFRGGINSFLGGLRQQVNDETQGVTPMPTATLTSSEGSNLTMENLERMVGEVTASDPQTAGQDMTSMYATISTPSITLNPYEGLMATRETTLEVPRLDKDWEKMYKSKKPVEEKVAHILVFSSQKMEEIKKNIENKEYEERGTRKVVREARKRVKEVTQIIEELKKKKEELEAESKEDKEKRAKDIVREVLKIPMVEKIEVDEKKRIFITTDEISINKDYWKEPRNAGKYQILVDFYQPEQSILRDGVRVLNITRRFLEYDHPCIKDTHCCWGTIERDIKKDFDDRDLVELVVDLLLYISSSKDDTGWITYSKKPPTERHKQGWEQFFEFAKPMPKNFSFLKYEKQEESGTIGRPGEEWTVQQTIDPNALINWDATTLQATPRPSRLSPLVVGELDFTATLAGYIGRLIVFISPDEHHMMVERLRVYIQRLERSGILFIREISYEPDRGIKIFGWTPQGNRQEMIDFPQGTIQGSDIHIFRFSDPSWFRDQGWGQPTIDPQLMVYGGGGGSYGIAGGDGVPSTTAGTRGVAGAAGPHGDPTI